MVIYFDLARPTSPILHRTPLTRPELTGRMRLQPGEKIDPGQVRHRRQPFLDDENVGIEHRGRRGNGLRRT